MKNKLQTLNAKQWFNAVAHNATDLTAKCSISNVIRICSGIQMKDCTTGKKSKGKVTKRIHDVCPLTDTFEAGFYSLSTFPFTFTPRFLINSLCLFQA